MAICQAILRDSIMLSSLPAIILRPHRGQTWAVVDTGPPHSGQVMGRMAGTTCGCTTSAAPNGVGRAGGPVWMVPCGCSFGAAPGALLPALAGKGSSGGTFSSRAGSSRTNTTSPHLGHCPFLPLALSGTDSCAPHMLQVTLIMEAPQDLTMASRYCPALLKFYTVASRESR